MSEVQAAVLNPPVSSNDHLRGPLTAPVILVEYGDYECPFCGRAYPIVEEIKLRLKDSICLAYRHFPLSQIHPHAERAAEAAEAAGAQGAFWPMHSMLFEHQHALGDAYLLEYASLLRLDTDRFEQELALRVYQPKVRAHFRSGVWSGVNGTPTFFINGVRHDGPWDLPVLLAAIQTAMVGF